MSAMTVAILFAMALGAKSAWRLFTERFPSPVDVATLSVLYYCLPLSIVAAWLPDQGTLVFLHPAASDPDIAAQSLGYGILAVLCLQFGRWLARRFRPSKMRLVFPITVGDALKTRMFVSLLLLMLGAGVVLFGIDAFVAGYAVDSVEGTGASGNALVYASIELLGLSMAYAYLINRAKPVRSKPMLLIATAGILLLLAVVRGKRLEVVSAFLPLGLLMFGIHPFFKSVRGRLVTVLVVAGLISLLASLRIGEAPNVVSLFFNLFSEGLYAGHSLPGIIDRINAHQLDYEYGVRFLVGLLAFIPRFVWPDKDEYLYAGNQALDGVAPLGATSMLAEVVLQGGAIAVIIAFVAMGAMFERLCGRLDDLDAGLRAGKLPANVLWYLIAVSIFIPHFRDGLVPAVKIGLQTVAFAVLLAGFEWHPSIMLRGMWGRRRRFEVPQDRHAASAGARLAQPLKPR